jgi:UDP-N-acetyl-alpha-D-muramoyl-L-alanyl-L-glutamate epimerase
VNRPGSGPTAAQAPSFDPAAYEAFRFSSFDFDPDGGSVALRYRLDDEHEFVETIELGRADPPRGERAAALERALRLLHLIAGVSYMKAAMPPRIVVETGPLSPGLASFLSSLYRHGLAEFAYRNGVDLRDRSWFEADGEAPAAAAPTAMPRRTLVPVGGGKDSIVTVEVLRELGEEVTLFSVGRTGPIGRTVEVAGLPHLQVERLISPTLLELNSRGALNGHVPVTAIVSAIAVAAAILHGADEIAMSNERSASVGSLEWNGIEVNHQWSKGLAFERGFRTVLADELGTGVDYYSALRPYSELQIARRFAPLERYHRAFTSCNAVFRRDPERRAASWCGDCPKCRFVYLILAPFVPRRELAAIFGSDLLDDPDQLPGYLELLGWEADKPFECVGEVAESIAAFRLLAADPGWRDGAVPAAVGERVLPHVDPGDSDPAAMLASGGPDEIPDRLRGGIDAQLRG